MKISVYSIEKSSDRAIDSLCEGFIKMSSRFAEIKNIALFSKQIAAAQTVGAKEAKESYTAAYEAHFGSFNIALDEKGEMIDSVGFSKLFDNNSDIRFFIGGAYGFEERFLARAGKVISLSRLTLAHKIAKTLLFEQIYRGLCIKNNHPYHKE